MQTKLRRVKIKLRAIQNVYNYQERLHLQPFMPLIPDRWTGLGRESNRRLLVSFQRLAIRSQRQYEFGRFHFKERFFW